MTQIQIRQDIQENWNSTSSVTPALGEFCYETDTETLKIGDGVHKFKDIHNHFVTSKETGDLKIDIDKNFKEFQSRKQNVIPKYNIDSDSYVYSELEKMKRSTFDHSKFQEYLSPSAVRTLTITDDGIVSGFSSKNVLYLPYVDFSKPFKITVDNFRLSTTTNGTVFLSAVIGEHGNNQAGVTITVNSTNSTHVVLKGTDSVIYSDYPSNKWGKLFQENNEYNLYFEWTGTQYIVRFYDTIGTLINELIVNSAVPIHSGSMDIGGNTYSGVVYTPFRGSIDLKQFSIVSDGVEVFNGNKTGIDQITSTLEIPYTLSKTGSKIVDAVYRDRVQDMYEQFGYTHYYTIGDEPEKYNVSVVGSPTLVGGVASGFNETNYITSNITIAGSVLKFETDFTTASIPDKTSMQDIIRSSNFVFGIARTAGETSPYTTRIRWGTNDNGWFANIHEIEENTHYNFISTLDVTSGTCKCELYKNGIKVDTTEQTRTGIVISTNSFVANIGSLGSTTNRYFKGSIDLSQFSIEADGKEVFRAYEPAIMDAYTLATHKGTDIIDSYSDSEGTYYEVRADLVQRCVGQIPTTSTEVTYPRPFRDADNIVQVSYFDVGESTATPTIAHIAPKLQTKDGFTIGATTNLKRNYYAEGKAVLG